MLPPGLIFELCPQAHSLRVPPALASLTTLELYFESFLLFPLVFPKRQAKPVTHTYVTTSPLSHHSSE